MTTFTTEDRILAEKDGSVTINVEGGTVTASPPHIVDSGASVMGTNALELADAIEKGGKDGFLQDEMVAMLRQLKAENDALRKTVDSLFAGLDSSLALNKAQVERKNET